jgi:hypothetical protein
MGVVMAITGEVAMTYHRTFAVAAVALLAGLGLAPAQQAPQSEKTTQPTGQQAPPSGDTRAVLPATGQEQQPAPDGDLQQDQSQVDRSLKTKSSQAGKQEAGSPVPTHPKENATTGVAPSDIDPQTMSSLKSARNAELDKLPLMAMPMPLNEAERRRIYESVSETKPADASNAVEPSHVLPRDVPLHELPQKVTAEIPYLRTLHYAKFENKVLLVQAPNRIVVGVIEK